MRRLQLQLHHQPPPPRRHDPMAAVTGPTKRRTAEANDILGECRRRRVASPHRTKDGECTQVLSSRWRRGAPLLSTSTSTTRPARRPEHPN